VINLRRVTSKSDKLIYILLILITPSVIMVILYFVTLEVRLYVSPSDINITKFCVNSDCSQTCNPKYGRCNVGHLTDLGATIDIEAEGYYPYQGALPGRLYIRKRGASFWLHLKKIPIYNQAELLYKASRFEEAYELFKTIADDKRVDPYLIILDKKLNPWKYIKKDFYVVANENRRLFIRIKYLDSKKTSDNVITGRYHFDSTKNQKILLGHGKSAVYLGNQIFRPKDKRNHYEIIYKNGIITKTSHLIQE
jgi:hypothetical protein